MYGMRAGKEGYSPAEAIGYHCAPPSSFIFHHFLAPNVTRYRNWTVSGAEVNTVWIRTSAPSLSTRDVVLK